MWGTIIAAVLGLLERVVVPLLMMKAGKDSARAQAAEKIMEKAQDAQRDRDDVSKLSDDQLDDELRSGDR